MESGKQDTPKQVDAVTNGLNTKMEVGQDDEDIFESMKNTQDEEHFVVKTKTPDDIGVENLVEDNDLISKDLTWEEMGIRKEIIEGLMEMSFIKPSKIQSTS